MRAILLAGVLAGACLTLAPPAAAERVCESVDPSPYTTDDTVGACVEYAVQADETPYVSLDVDCWAGRGPRCPTRPFEIGDPS